MLLGDVPAKGGAGRGWDRVRLAVGGARFIRMINRASSKSCRMCWALLNFPLMNGMGPVAGPRAAGPGLSRAWREGPRRLPIDRLDREAKARLD
jgi:hypothetical protein